MIKLDIFYEFGAQNTQLCSNSEEMNWLINQMFDQETADTVIKQLKANRYAKLFGETDRWFDKHLPVRCIEADFHYGFPDEKKTINPNELKKQVYYYLDNGYLAEEIPELLDISLAEVKRIINAEENR